MERLRTLRRRWARAKMNAVEIEEAVSALASAPYKASEFPYAFLEAFGNKETTIKRLRAGSSNASDVLGGVLQRNNIHIAVCRPGEVGATLAALRQSPKTTAAKAIEAVSFVPPRRTGPGHFSGVAQLHRHAPSFRSVVGGMINMNVEAVAQTTNL